LYVLKNYKKILTFGKIAIIIISYVYIGVKLYQYDNYDGFFNQFNSASIFSVIILCSIFILMFFNWATETIKWQYLLQKIQAQNFIQAMKAVYAGITVSIFTPNRVGEFAGRIFFLKKEFRIQAVCANITGNLSQLLITLVAGIAGTLLLFKVKGSLTMFSFSSQIALVLACILTLIFLYFFFHLSKIKTLLERFSFIKKHPDFTSVLTLYSRKDIYVFLGLSLVRYVIFSVQFFLAIKIFGIEMSLLNTGIAISLTWFVMAIIPTVGISEIGVRGSVALFFFGLFVQNPVSVISATLLLWIINLALPAIIGSFWVIRIKE